MKAFLGVYFFGDQFFTLNQGRETKTSEVENSSCQAMSLVLTNRKKYFNGVINPSENKMWGCCFFPHRIISFLTDKVSKLERAC
jgi:hypothetical protein